MGKKYLFLRLGCLALVWLCITSVSSSGQPPDLDTMLDKIQQTYERTSALTARFDQTATLTSLNRQQTSSGRVYIEKPPFHTVGIYATRCTDDPLRWDDSAHLHT